MYEMDTTSMRLEEQTQTLTQPLINFNRLYPNPTSNEVFIEYNLVKGESGMLEFYNAIGQQFLGESNISGNGKMAISLSIFPKGIYFVSLKVNGQLRNFWKVSFTE
ncbi:MAG: T9SS type A sorting domain-containing protein [Bacteroidia bacterium]|nr:T9SS type A sorting domain-containing protein [Bacteroidia bacterium]